MAEQTNARVFMAGSSPEGRARLVRVDIDGSEARVLDRAYVDPMVRSGRGHSVGTIAALGSMNDRAGASWLLAAVERGRPRLIEPERLGVVALLGRRREWRGAAEGTSPFLPVICDRAPLTVAGGQFLLTRAPGGGVDLVRACAGEPIERWRVGEHATRAELIAGDDTLALHVERRVATIDVAELVPGGCPLTDPRDVELPLRWRSLPRSVVGVCDLLDDAVLRVIEREGERWRVAELELAEDDARRRASWAIDRPERWLARAGSLWLASGGAWTRIAAGVGVVERSSTLGRAMSPATLELDSNGHPWLWLWREDVGELQRVDALALVNGPVERWSIALELRVRSVLVLVPSPAPDPRTIVHADEFAELLALEPTLRAAWDRWFDR
jgi:hypothetical protein